MSDPGDDRMAARLEYAEFDSGGNTLRGMMHIPDAPRPMPAVLLLHGLGGNKIGSDFLLVAIAKELSRAGIAALRFDFAGSGESDGEFEEVTLAAETADARVALELLSCREEVDADRMGVLGYSAGGYVASRILDDARLGSAVLLSAVASTRRILDARGEDETDEALRSVGYVAHGALRLGRGMIEEARSEQWPPGLPVSSAHVLILHGEKDETVDVEHSRMYEELLSSRVGPRTELHVVSEMEHRPGTPPRQEDVLSRISRWFADTLRTVG